MPDNAPRLLMVAHATPRPVSDGPDGRLWRFVTQFAKRGHLKLLTLIDRPINQHDWRTIHDAAPDTVLVRRGRLARYARLPHALDTLLDEAPFHMTVLSAPSLMSLRPALPHAPIAVDFAGCRARPGLAQHADATPDFALLDHPDTAGPTVDAVPPQRRLTGPPETVAPDLVARLYADPHADAIAAPVQPTFARRAA
ncbi:MAG: hypothetical protein AAF842_04580 [Planctomycetota bacterium]